MKFMKLVLALMLCGNVSAETNHVITSAAELARTVSRKGTVGIPFRLEATALSRPIGRRQSFVVMNKTGGVSLYDIRERDDPAILPGDRILVCGVTEPRHSRRPEDGLVNANCTNVVILSHGQPPPPTPITADDLERNDLLYKPVYIDGILIDVRKDEIDPRHTLFVLDCSNRMAYAAIGDPQFSAQTAKPMIGSTVRIKGTLHHHIGTRTHSRRLVAIHDPNAVNVLKPPSDNLFDAPEIGETDGLSPEAVIALGRRKAMGRVLAVWNGETALLRTMSDELARVELVTAPPAVGDAIEVVGYAETDLFQVNLANALWRKAEMPPATEEPATDVAAKELLEDTAGQRKFNMSWNGKKVRLTGIVRDIHESGGSGVRILLDDDGRMVAVDCGAAPDIARRLRADYLISVMGVCVMETENWNRHLMLPRVTGMFISASSPDDIKVLATPPWWTPARLVCVIGVLVLLIVAILAWNVSLRTLSEWRGRELYRNQIERAKSELRVDERTRLAADLHDYLAQNLTAISYRLAAAERSRTMEPEALTRHLATATRMLGSCRTELRRCLWDLRNDALDEPDFATAIRKSAETVAADADVSISWNIARARISDSTAHTILSIIRELVSNAVRHGKARHVRISGELSAGMLRFSVGDDGCGFNPSDAEGAADGHFGLDGIRERLRRHNGELEIKSSPGKGAIISICMQPTGEKR